MTHPGLLTERLRPAWVLAILLAAGAAPVSAQSVVTGRVLEDGTDRPINTVDIRLIDATGVTRVRALSDERGQFRMEVPDSGMYQLSARRVGYAPILADSVSIGQDDEVEIIVRLATDAIALDAVTVVAQRPVTPARILRFRERADLNQRMGIGRIYTREDLDRLRPTSAQQVLDGIVWAGRCSPVVLLDGLPVSGRITDLSYEDLEGIEIYRGVTQIPPEYYRYGMCGLAMVWTRADPPNMRPWSWWRAGIAAGLVAIIALLTQ